MALPFLPSGLSKLTGFLFLSVALILALASEWMPVTGTDGAQVLVKAVFIFILLWFFGAWLPHRTTLPMQIMAAMILGILVGWLLPKCGAQAFISEYLGIFGRLFILLLTFVILPLIFVSVLNGAAGIGDPKRLGTVGFKCLTYYFCTTALAVVIGLTLVNTLQPGRGRESLRAEVPSEKATGIPDVASVETVTGVLIQAGLVKPEAGAAFLKEQESRRKASERKLSLGLRLQDQILPALIQNPIMAGQNPVAVIFFAILLGVALASLGEWGQPALGIFQSLDKAFITIILWVMRLAALGVFSLMARAVSELGMEYMFTLAKYFGTVMLGLGVHFCLLTCVLCPVLSGIRPRRFLSAMLPVIQVAFSTSSSSATLPVSITCATKRMGADPHISNFMLPVGATVNMDGTALYLTVASLFIAQVYGIRLGFQEQFMVFLMAVMASIGTAGIPGASIGLMGIVLAAADIPVEGIAIVIGVDRFLDMSRTVVNVIGDCVGVVYVSKSEGLLDTVYEEKA